MTNKPTFSMSESGGCPKSIAAPLLGYEPIPDSEDSRTLLEHATRCEDLAAMQMLDLGFRLEPSSLCPKCKEELGNERYGIHVELEESLFRLIGHLDRRLVHNDRHFPVEIKSLGRFTWNMFSKSQFDNNPSYAGQEACYLQAEQSPGIYWVMNRDNGQSLKYIVNDFNNDVNLNGFAKIELPVAYNQIVDNLNLVVIAISDGELPEAEYSEDSPHCRWCKFVYLCEKKVTKVDELDLPSLVDAARMYKEGKELEAMADELKARATGTLLIHSKQSGVNKFRTGGISWTYSGLKTKKYTDEKLLRELVDENILKRVIKESKPFEDYRIRILKGEE